PGEDAVGLLLPRSLRRVVGAGLQRFQRPLCAPRGYPGHVQRRLVRPVRDRHHQLLRRHVEAELDAAAPHHGPWTHMGSRNTMSWAGEVDFGPDSVWGFPRLNPDQQRWFDRWLTGSDNGVEREPPVHIFVMGGGDGQRNAEGRLNHG